MTIWQKLLMPAMSGMMLREGREKVQELQPGPVEPGSFELSAPVAELEGLQSGANVWQPAP